MKRYTATLPTHQHNHPIPLWAKGVRLRGMEMYTMHSTQLYLYAMIIWRKRGWWLIQSTVEMVSTTRRFLPSDINALLLMMFCWIYLYVVCSVFAMLKTIAFLWLPLLCHVEFTKFFSSFFRCSARRCCCLVVILIPPETRASNNNSRFITTHLAQSELQHEEAAAEVPVAFAMFSLTLSLFAFGNFLFESTVAEKMCFGGYLMAWRRRQASETKSRRVWVVHHPRNVQWRNNCNSHTTSESSRVWRYQKTVWNFHDDTIKILSEIRKIELLFNLFSSAFFSWDSSASFPCKTVSVSSKSKNLWEDKSSSGKREKKKNAKRYHSEESRVFFLRRITPIVCSEFFR